MPIDPYEFGEYSMAVFALENTRQGTDNIVVRHHHDAPPTLPTATSVGRTGDGYEQLDKPALGASRTSREDNPDLAPKFRHMRSGTMTIHPLSDRKVKTVSPFLLDNIKALSNVTVEKHDLGKHIELDYQLAKVEIDFLGMPKGGYFVGHSRLDLDADDHSSTSTVYTDPMYNLYGPLLYHTVGERTLHIHDLTRLSTTYGPPYKLKMEVLLDSIGTADEAILLKTIRANCLAPEYVNVNDRAKLAVYLAMATTWRTGQSSEMVELVQLLIADPAVRDFVQGHDLLPGAKPFWSSYWYNLEHKLEPDAMDVAFAPVHTRRAQTVQLKPHYGKEFPARVKDIKYGNANALVEQAAVWLYALSGLHGPDAKIAQRAQRLFGGFDADTRRDYGLHQDEPDRFCVIVSRLLPGFKDLGILLTDADTMHTLIHPGDRARCDELLAKYAEWNTLFQELEALPPDADGTPARLPELRHANAKRLEALQRLYPLLPQSMRDDVATSYLVSHWLMNWDVVNIGLANLGFYKEHGSGKWVSAAVDFGNSLTLGFGGRNKEDSWETVGSANGLNDPARIDDPDPFARTETRNTIDPRWTGDMRYGVRQPANVPRRDGIGSVNVEVTSSFTNAGNLPRIPVPMLVQQQIQAETLAVGMDDGGWTTRPEDPTPRPPVRPDHGEFNPLSEKRQAPYLMRDFAPFAEAAFRLSLVPDGALEAMTLQVWPWQGADTDEFTRKFCPRTGTDLPDHAELAARLGDRRDEIVAQFDIKRWAERHPAKAQKVYAEVFAAVLGLTGIAISPPDWGVRDDSGRWVEPPSVEPKVDLVEQYGLKDAPPRSADRSVDDTVVEMNLRAARQRERVMSRPDALLRRIHLLIARMQELRDLPQVAQYLTAWREHRQLGTPGSGVSMSLVDRANRRNELQREMNLLDSPTLEHRREMAHLQATIDQVKAQYERAFHARMEYLDAELGSSTDDNAIDA